MQDLSYTDLTAEFGFWEGTGPFALEQLTNPASGAWINWATLLALGLGDIVAIDFMERVFAAENPATFRALNKAIIEAAGYAQNPANRPEIAKAISERAFLNQPVEVVEAVLTGNFQDGLGNTKEVPDRIGFDPYPWQSFANWISSQLVRWDLQGDDKVPTAIADGKYDEVGKEVFMTDLARELAQEVGLNPPEDVYRTETLEFDTFDPAQPQAYVDEQIKKYGV